MVQTRLSRCARAGQKESLLQMVCDSRDAAPPRRQTCVRSKVPASGPCWSEKRASHSVGVRECDARAFQCALWPVGTFCWTQVLQRHTAATVQDGLAEHSLSCRASSGHAEESHGMLARPAAASSGSATLPDLRSGPALVAASSAFCAFKHSEIGNERNTGTTSQVAYLSP